MPYLCFALALLTRGALYLGQNLTSNALPALSINVTSVTPGHVGFVWQPAVRRPSPCCATWHGPCSLYPVCSIFTDREPQREEKAWCIVTSSSVSVWVGWSTKFCLHLWWGEKTRAGELQECRGEKELDEETEKKKERLGLSLAWSESELNLATSWCWWGRRAEQGTQRAGTGGDTAWTDRQTDLHKLFPLQEREVKQADCRARVAHGACHTCLRARAVIVYVTRSWATTCMETFNYYSTLKMYGRVRSHSCWLRAPIQQCLIRNEHCKKREGEKERYRLLWEVRRCLGLSWLQSFHWQCQQYFSPNIQALLAQIYLFTWFMVHAYTNLSMHSRKIFQHLRTFVRLHGMFGGKKGATYILQWLFHTTHVIDVKTAFSSW